MYVPHLVFLAGGGLVQAVVLGVVQQVGVHPLHVQRQHLLVLIHEWRTRLLQLERKTKRTFITFFISSVLYFLLTPKGNTVKVYGHRSLKVPSAAFMHYAHPMGLINFLRIDMMHQCFAVLWREMLLKGNMQYGKCWLLLYGNSPALSFCFCFLWNTSCMVILFILCQPLHFIPFSYY